MSSDFASAPKAYPLCFQPLYKERIWGGRKLASLPGRELPAGIPVGESWEVTDRPEGVSVVLNGPDRDRTLRSLMEERRDWLTGGLAAAEGRFPWLVKYLDAREDLSLQVHPPTHHAGELGGEPKTEMWYLLEAEPGARLYTGLRRGVTRDEFERRSRDGTVASLFHVHPVTAGDAMFLPSGRVHALGGGNLVFEVQQNSDTTYRVFDWNRVGADGRPRELHLERSLASINFFDCEPPLVVSRFHLEGTGLQCRPLVRDSLFAVDLWRLAAGAELVLPPGHLLVVAGVSGGAVVSEGGIDVDCARGSVAVLPAASRSPVVRSRSGTELLVVRPGT